jgi:hypothetical protein
MAAEPQHPETPRTVLDEQIETVRVRRVPKYGVFLVVGAALGVLVAMILTFAFQGTDQPSVTGVEYSQTQVFGFLALIGVAVGVAVGGIVALVFDRILGKRAREVPVDHERVRLDED